MSQASTIRPASRLDEGARDQADEMRALVAELLVLGRCLVRELDSIECGLKALDDGIDVVTEEHQNSPADLILDLRERVHVWREGRPFHHLVNKARDALTRNPIRSM